MKTAIIIPTYNRPHYLKQCFDSLLNTYLPSDLLIYIIDDASTDKETIRLIKEFNPQYTVRKEYKKQNKGVYDSFITMYDYCFSNGYDYVINVAPDSIVNNYFFDMMVYYKSLFPNKIISGFNALTLSEKGTPRHPIVFDGDWYKQKKTSCSLCFGIDKDIYEKTFLTTLMELMAKKRFCYDTIASGKSEGVICTVPSVAEHIGFESTLGHNFNPDVSCDFMPYHEIGSKKLVTVNMATYPPREEVAKKVIGAIVQYDIVDKVRIYLNEYDYVPEWCNHPKIEYLKGGENLKDSGKFFWAGAKKNEYYFTIDDDLMFPEEYFAKHLELLRNNNKCFVSLHGKVLAPAPKSFRDVTENYHWSKTTDDDYLINFPGTGVMAFDNSKYSFPIEMFKYHGMADLWIAKYCQENNIPCILRKHLGTELTYILQNKNTLWNAQASMVEQHREILQSIKKWKLIKL